MKPSDALVVFMDIGECADVGRGPTIVEVFTSEDSAESLASELREKVKKKWRWENKKLNEREKEQLHGTVQVITLEAAIQKIKDEIHDEYASYDPDY